MTIGDATRLCIVTPYQSGGGAEYQIDCLLNVLRPSGEWNVHLLVRHPDPASSTAGVIRIGSDTRLPRLGYATLMRPLFELLDELQPQVIYQRVACGFTGLCTLYGRRKKVPVVWHVAHDSDVSPEAGIYGGNPLRRLLEKRSVVYAATRVPHIVTQTQRQAALLRRHYARTATAVIPNFQPDATEPLDKPADRIRVVWVANFKPWKRPELFVKLAAALADIANVDFVMVGAPATGAADRAWSAALEEAMRHTANLRHVGSLRQADVNALLAQSHLFVNTSTEEGFPNTFIQAWMRGVPVISLGVDPDGVLERERIGVCATSETLLAEAVRRLIQDEQERRACGARALLYASRVHSLANATQLATLLQRVAAVAHPADAL